MTEEADRARRDQYQLDSDFEKWKHSLEIVRIEYTQIYQAVFANGAAAMRALLVLNGAAAIALLTLMGHGLSTLANPERSSPALASVVSGLTTPLFLLLIGAGCAGLIPGIGYLAQTFYSRHQWGEQGRASKARWASICGDVCKWISVGLFIVGMALFVLAGWKAKEVVDSAMVIAGTTPPSPR